MYYNKPITATNRRKKMTKQQELQVRRQAAKHLRGISARQNAAQIDLLETQIAHEELVSRVGADELARWDSMEPSIGLRSAA